MKTIISLFDGYSGAQQAIKDLGVTDCKYYACEIDKYAISTTMKNHPNTIQLGDVTECNFTRLGDIHLLVGGSPCQGFSFAGKQLNFEDPRSKLFFEFVRAKEECKPKWFLLENVYMKQEYQNVISEHLGVQPIEINSRDFTAQNRRRLYWLGRKVESEAFLCYSCWIKEYGDAEEKRRIQEKTQREGETEVLGETQKRHLCMQSLSEDLLKDREERNYKDLLRSLLKGKQEEFRSEPRQKESEGEKRNIQEQEQRENIAISEGLPKNRKGKRGNEKSGCQKMQKNKETEVYSEQIFEEEVRLLERLQCVRCEGRLNHRPHNTSFKEWGQHFKKLASAVQAVQLGKTYYRSPVMPFEDKGIVLRDILLDGGNGVIKVNGKLKERPIKSQCIDANYFKGVDNHGQRTMVAINYSSSQREHGVEDRSYRNPEKSHTLTASGYGSKAFTGVVQVNSSKEAGGKQPHMQNRVYDSRGKSPALTSSFANRTNVLEEQFLIRKLHPIECERLQGLPDNYTEGVSNTQRYKMLGNGFTVPVISHILCNIFKGNNNSVDLGIDDIL